MIVKLLSRVKRFFGVLVFGAALLLALPVTARADAIIDPVYDLTGMPLSLLLTLIISIIVLAASIVLLALVVKGREKRKATASIMLGALSGFLIAASCMGLFVALMEVIS